MTKLKKLCISDTDLDSGLEYLPNSLEVFYCSVFYRKDAKCQTIYNLFADEWGNSRRRMRWKIKNLPQKLKAYKQKVKAKARELLKDEFKIRDRKIVEPEEEIT